MVFFVFFFKVNVGFCFAREASAHLAPSTRKIRRALRAGPVWTPRRLHVRDNLHRPGVYIGNKC